MEKRSSYVCQTYSEEVTFLKINASYAAMCTAMDIARSISGIGMFHYFRWLRGGKKIREENICVAFKPRRRPL